VIRQTNIGERALKIIKSKTESLEEDKSKETIQHIYNSEKEIKSTTAVFDFMIFNALSPMFVCLITQKAHE
jgi:hypothetical protein